MKPNNQKDWSGNKNSIYSTLGASNHSEYERVERDYYATNPLAIDDLMKIEDFSDCIWECACGEGHLSKRMSDKWGKQVYSTDLVNRGFGNDFFDFLTCDRKFEGDIITNPPYNKAKEFVEKAIELTNNKVAMFLKLTFLEGQGRYNFFKKYPPVRIWVYSFRQSVARNGEEEMFNKSSAVCYAWFIWEKGNKNLPIINWISK
jgi:hypothetical protein